MVDRGGDAVSGRRRSRVADVTLTPEQELWGMALWVEKAHGSRGPSFIARKIDALARSGEQDGVRLWREVARRFDCLAGRQEDKRSS
ncbi:DUF6961 family protein [Tsuneonella sp. HG222]